IPETTGTIPGNARQKADYVLEHYQHDCFSEDTGLEVTALDGRPGVDTAFYAGPARDAVANMEKVLAELAAHEDRSARFRTVITLHLEGEVHTFEGIVNGTIATERSGAEGFGYDPIFIPEGHQTTFAEMDRAAKNAISHRGRAIAKLQAFLQARKS
ncbi:MAG: RdgB/HAM1 family non-canonical purine NTP pyrophosphatase, partial [Bacteroidota bacterium]